MTSIEIGEASREPRRDRWQRYLVVPPEGGEPVGYTRVTTVAKVLDSGGGLASWKAAMTAQGAVLRRGLFSRWEALMAEHNGDPWYAGEESKKACKDLVEECSAVGGANDRREMGSSLHTISALVDVGRSPQLSEETGRDITAYRAGLASAGVTIVDGQVEVVVVIDGYRVAGTFDRLVRAPGFELPLIADLKTGASLEYSWQTIAVQLAAYSRADAIYVQGPDPDGSKDQRIAMPAVDQNYGLIMWLPAGKGSLELWLVDLQAGWLAFQHSMWVRDWRNGHPEVRFNQQPFVDPPSNLATLLEESVKLAQKTHPTNKLLGRGFKLQERVDAIGWHPEARKDLVASWPLGIPPPRAAGGDQFDAIEQVLEAVEARWNLQPAGPNGQGKVASVTRLFDPPDKEPT